MKKNILILCCAFMSHASAQDLASKLKTLETTLVDLKNALSGGTPNVTKPVTPIIPKTIQTPAETVVDAYFTDKRGFIELPLEGHFGEVRTSDGKTILKGKLYYGVIKPGNGNDVGNLGFYAPELNPGTEVKDFFVNGKFMYPADKKKSDTYNLTILFNPVRDASYDQNKKNFEKYNSNVAKLIKKTKDYADGFITAYQTLSNANPGKPFQDSISSFDQNLKLITANLKSIVDAAEFSLINDTNLNSLKSIVQNAKTKFFDDINTQITAIGNKIGPDTKSTLKANISKKLQFFEKLTKNPQVEELIAYSTKITTQKPFVVGDPENKDAKIMYEDLVKEEKKSSGQILTTIHSQFTITGIRNDLELWEKESAKYSPLIQDMVKNLRALFNDKKYDEADTLRGKIKNEIDAEEQGSGSGWE